MAGICYDILVPDTQFSIKTDVFEGPLELLLDLIEKRKLLINDIALASVTDEYMAYVTTLAEGHMHDTAQFVLVASTLLLIKSKSLLPVIDLTDEEEAGVEDLEKRLKLYQIYRSAGICMRQIFGTRMLYQRPFVPLATSLFIPDSFTTPDALTHAMARVIHNLPQSLTPRTHVSVRKVMSLEEMMKRLEERITAQMKIRFSAFSGNSEKAEIIISFLAVLELIKQGLVMVEQEARFADFDIERESVDTPRYL